MGVSTQAECDGEAPFKLRCTACDTEYWTDETMANDCPDCGSGWDWEPLHAAE